MPWRSKQRRAASMIEARVRAASSLVRLMTPVFTYVLERIYNSAMHYSFVVAPLVLLAACSQGDAKQAPAGPPPMAVTVLQATAEKVPVSVHTVGQAEGPREVEIPAPADGLLEKRPFQGGAPVAPRQTLFESDAAPY